MLALFVLLGCQQDLVLAVGDLTGVAAAAERGRAKPLPDDAIVFELPSEQPDIVIVPLEGTAPGVGGAARDGREPAGGPSASGGGFNPVSVPQVPNEGTGVRFEGVRGKSPIGSVRSGASQMNEMRRR